MCLRLSATHLQREGSRHLSPTLFLERYCVQPNTRSAATRIRFAQDFNLQYMIARFGPRSLKYQPTGNLIRRVATYSDRVAAVDGNPCQTGVGAEPRVSDDGSPREAHDEGPPMLFGV